MEKKRAFSTNGAGSTAEECKLIHSYLSVQSSSPKWIKDLHIKLDTLNLIEEKELGAHGHRRKFSEQNTNSLFSKFKNLQKGPHKICKASVRL